VGKATRVPPRQTSERPPAFAHVISALRRLYGKPRPPAVTDPLEIILFENIAYLADDERREKAFQALKTRVGLSPAKILAAPRSVLREIASNGIVPDQTVAKIRSIAAIAVEEFGGSLASVTRLPIPAAKKALRKFPSIGDPGAEKVLLFSRSAPILALESNGLRVLLRLGFGTEDKNYARSYRSAQAAVDAQLKTDCDWLIEVHQLLRRHGQELCRRSHPSCEICPLRPLCPYAASRVAAGG
jgi:endonuclease III